MQAIPKIKQELKIGWTKLHADNKVVGSAAPRRAHQFDIEMLETTGHCAGIENYSRYLTGPKSGRSAADAVRVLPENAMLIVDESHVTVPQIGGMYQG